MIQYRDNPNIIFAADSEFGIIVINVTDIYNPKIISSLMIN